MNNPHDQKPGNGRRKLATQEESTSHYLERTARNHYWLGGAEGQKKLRELKIGVAGCGGMGSHIAELLVRIGVGKIKVADPDTVDLSNLNRQVIANLETQGMRKVDALALELRRISRGTEIEIDPAGIQSDNVEAFVDGCDAIVDEIDVYPLDRHVMLHRAARKKGLSLYSAYVVGLGTHFYKFQGDDYRFEDFIGSGLLERKPTAEELIQIFGHPLPDYVMQGRLDGYLGEIRDGRVPIFGPTTLLGQSLVVIRMIQDLLGLFPEAAPTPVMPEFLTLDPVDLAFQVARVPGTQRATGGKPLRAEQSERRPDAF
jgi:molybdopterin/thiamine biosynthesis adenylyltransferase